MGSVHAAVRRLGRTRPKDVTGFICHVSWEVSIDVTHRLMDGIDSDIINTAEIVAAEVNGVQHAHARARWTGRTLRVEVEGWLDPDTTLSQADQLGQQVADGLAAQLPEMRSFNWTARGI